MIVSSHTYKIQILRNWRNSNRAEETITIFSVMVERFKRGKRIGNGRSFFYKIMHRLFLLQNLHSKIRIIDFEQNQNRNFECYKTYTLLPRFLPFVVSSNPLLATHTDYLVSLSLSSVLPVWSDSVGAGSTKRVLTRFRSDNNIYGASRIH